MATPPPPLADVADFRAWPGVVVPPGNEPAAEAVLRYVSARVRLVSTQAGGPTWLDDAGDLVANIPDVISQLVVAVAARVWANPEGKVSKTTGPFGAAWSEKLQGVTLSPEEKAMVREVVGGGTNTVAGLSSVKLSAPSGTRASTLPPRIEDQERW